VEEHTIWVHTGPVGVELLGARTAAEIVGTERLGFRVWAESETEARDYVRHIFESEGLKGYL
jgi:hypothetical protein